MHKSESNNKRLKFPTWRSEVTYGLKQITHFHDKALHSSYYIMYWNILETGAKDRKHSIFCPFVSRLFCTPYIHPQSLTLHYLLLYKSYSFRLWYAYSLGQELKFTWHKRCPSCDIDLDPVTPNVPAGSAVQNICVEDRKYTLIESVQLLKEFCRRGLTLLVCSPLSIDGSLALH